MDNSNKQEDTELVKLDISDLKSIIISGEIYEDEHLPNLTIIRPSRSERILTSFRTMDTGFRELSFLLKDTKLNVQLGFSKNILTKFSALDGDADSGINNNT